MGRSFLPTADKALAAFSLNFSTLLTANFAAYGLPQSTAASYGIFYDTYNAALTAAQQPPTRGNATVLAKNSAKKNLIILTREIARTIVNNMNVNNAQRQELGLTIRKIKPTPVPAPSTRPSVDISSVSVRTVTVHIHDGPADKRGKAAGAIGAKVYSYIGDSYPSDPTLWAYQGDSTKSKYPIAFPDSVASGTQVWVCAAWYNRKGETGPVSVPITTNLQGGGAGATSSSMKIAA